MALGDTSKALKIVSRMKGWDPDVIPARPGVGDGRDYPAHNIADFNKAPNPWELGAQSVGQLPEGLKGSYPEFDAPDQTESVTFNTPDAGRENEDRRTSGADPFPTGWRS